MIQLVEKPVSRTLRTEVVDIIRDAIVSGGLKPGEHLKETAIANQLSVSRSPVREAFRQLEQEGLIISIANQGSFVKSFDEDDVREIFTLRATLEDLACEIILREGKLQPADFKRLEDYIFSKSGFGRLLKMWQGLRAQIQVLFYQRFQAFEQVPQTVDTDHSAILKALRKGDLAMFSEINKEINARVAEECVQVIRTLRDQ
jgi:DNA-binding GntR family transcriptional regulator